MPGGLHPHRDLTGRPGPIGPLSAVVVTPMIFWEDVSYTPAGA